MSTPDSAGNEICDVPVLDLSSYTSADQLAGISSIHDVGTVIVPRSLAPALGRIRVHDVGSVVTVPDGAHVRVHTGSLQMGGDGIADPGGDNEVLVVVGMLLITSPFDRVGFRDVAVTGAVLAPHGTESALGAGLTHITGAVTYYPYREGQRIRQIVGNERRDGSVFAGDGADLLLVAGQLVVTGPVTEIGIVQALVAGQAVLPRSAQALLGPVLEVNGQAIWYGGENPRLLADGDVCDREFFELLDPGTPLVVLGDIRIADDVPPQLLREKVSEIASAGTITAPRALRSTLMLRTTEQQGHIVAAEEADPSDADAAASAMAQAGASADAGN